MDGTISGLGVMGHCRRGHLVFTAALAIFSIVAAHAQEQRREDPAGLSCAQKTRYDPKDFRRVLSNVEFDATVELRGKEWNDTLIQNCRIRSTGGDGMVIGNVERLVVTGCRIENVKGSGIRVSSTGSTKRVTIDGNEISDVGRNGISAAQRADRGIDHIDLKILNNRIHNSGQDSSSGLTHGIYIQASDFLIEGNEISGTRDGNGISVRSSGSVRCNRVVGTSKDKKPAIRYYSDHVTGPSKTLSIERNAFASDTIGIDLAVPAAETVGSASLDHVVRRFIIRNNVVRAPVPMKLAPRYNSPPFLVERD